MQAYLPRLAAQWPTGTAHRTVAGALVFVDVSGFTALSERLAAHGREGAEELTRLINDVHGSLVAAAVGLGGDIVKFGGDAELVLFDGPDHARRAAVAVARMQETLTEPRTSRLAGSVQLSMTCGLHVGEFQVAVVRPGHRELVVFGPNVSETLRCESSAPAGGVVVSPAAAAQVPVEWLGEDAERGRLLDVPVAAAAELEAVVDVRVEIDGDDLRAWVPIQLVESLERGLEVGDHRIATVGFVSLHGTDALAADPEEATAVLDRVGSVVGEEAAQRNVTMLATDVAPDSVKFFLAAGAPIATERGAEAMLQAGLAMLRRLPDVDLRIGVHRARVFAGNVGAPDRHTYAVQGRGTNLAARLCGSAERGELVVMQGMATPAVFECVARPPREFKGIDGPVATEVVTGTHDEHEAAPDRSTPFVGRGRELGLLAARAGRAFGGTGQVTLVAGPPGVGKTRVLLELVDAVDPPRIVRDGARATEVAVPYALVGRVLRRLLDVEVTSDPTETGRRLARRITEVAPDLAPWTPLLAMPLSAVVPPTPQVADLAREHRRDRMVATVLELLERLLTGPTLLALEDLHWVDPGSRVVIERLADRCPSHPWHLVVTSRSTRWSPGGDVVQLDPLSDEAVRDLVDAVAASPMLPEARADVLRRADGNPLFAIELARAGTSAEQRPDDVAYPASLEELVARRIDELERSHAVVLRDASVVGVVVDLDVLDHVLEQVDADLDVDVLEPEEWEPLDEFVELPTSWEARFRQDTYRDVAYEGLSFEARRRLHGAVASVLQVEVADDDAQGLAVLTRHLVLAQDHARVWDVGRRAGRASLELGATAEATELLDQAVAAAAALGDVADQELAAGLEALGDAAQLAGDPSKAVAAFDRAADLYASAWDVVRVQCRAADVRRAQGALDDALARLDHAEAVANRASADGARDRAEADAHIAIARTAVLTRQGRYEDVAVQGRHAIRAATEAERDDLAAQAYYLVDFVAGHLDDEWEVGQGVPVLQALGDQLGLWKTYCNVGVHAYYRGDWDAALEHWNGALESGRRAGDVVGVATIHNNIGEIHSDRGELDSAEGAFLQAQRDWQAAGYPLGLALSHANLGRLATRRGDHAAAAEELARGRAGFQALGAAAWVAECDLRRAELALAARDHGEAREVATATLRDRQDLEPALRSDLLRVIGTAEAMGGDVSRGLATLREAIDVAVVARLPYQEALAVAAAAELARAAGEPSARNHRRRARELFRQLGIARAPRLQFSSTA